MRRIRSITAQTPAIVISTVALALSLGGGAYASTQSPSAAHSTTATHAASFKWTSLGLKDGWVSSNSIYASGNPKVALQSNIVYLSGSLHQPTPGNEIFASLPAKFRPAHNMWITVYTFGGTSGTLYIGHNGIMEASASGACGSGNSAQCYTSLATVSYPVKS
jgi:hypothetical protein